MWTTNFTECTDCTAAQLKMAFNRAVLILILMKSRGPPNPHFNTFNFIGVAQLAIHAVRPTHENCNAKSIN